MKRAFAIATVTLAALRPAPARACGFPGFEATVASAAEALAARPEAVSTPLAIVGLGHTTDGDAASVALGWGWGEHDRGFFAGSSISRVLVDVERAKDHTAVALTYGWYNNQLIGLGFDAGVAADGASVGPTTRVTLAVRGVGVQLTGGLAIGREPHAVGGAQLVIDVMDLAGQI